MSDFNLRAVVREVLAGTNEADPGVIAGMVTARIDAADRDAALSQMMRLFVRQVMSEERTAAAPFSSSSGGQLTRGSHAPIAAAAGRPSLRVAGIRDGWQRALRSRVHVGHSEYKLLADCNYDDLYAAAAEREDLARRNQAWARHYHVLAALLTEHDVETVGELPSNVLMVSLGAVA